ncbi:MAG: hypothetical protein IT294_17285 [Deltaproteobacteria bacterium]|nr:hypothetical protein [Deltaproteobacteria bacterium]
MPDFLRMAYFYPIRLGRHPQLSSTRDIEASMITGDVLHASGYSYRGSLYQHPASLDREGNVVLPVQERPALGPEDVLTCNTRPPMDDFVVGDRLTIRRSFTFEEHQLMAEGGPFRRWFERCSRSEVVLSNEAAKVSPEIRARQRMLFRQHGGANYASYGPIGGDWVHPEKSDARTAAFLVFADAWAGGPKLLLCFGMSGIATLVWARLLATRLRPLVFTTAFVMAELQGRWPQRPRTLDFVDACDVRVLGAAPVPKPHTATPPRVGTRRASRSPESGTGRSVCSPRAKSRDKG